jgi:hypothetical protein
MVRTSGRKRSATYKASEDSLISAIIIDTEEPQATILLNVLLIETTYPLQPLLLIPECTFLVLNGSDMPIK